MMKAFLGMGLLGSNFVKAMRRRDEQIRVWNRTYSKAEKLKEFGAEVFEKLADAVAEVDRVHMVLRDDASVDELLAKAEPHLKTGATIIDHTTTSVQGAKDRTQQWKEKGFFYQHAPVLMGPKNALESTGFMAVSGDQKIIGDLLPDLSKMTGKVLNLGETVGKAAGMKLISNLILLTSTSGLSDALALAKSVNIKGEEIQDLFQDWKPGPMIKGHLQKILKGDFTHPSWELTMARKDARLMMEEAQKAGNKMVSLPALATEMDQWIENGHAHEDWTVFASNNLT